VWVQCTCNVRSPRGNQHGWSALQTGTRPCVA
jgi:hypothetical protein